jgi:hypothetical protein
MNERIRQLAEQAGFYYTDKTGFITPAGCDPAKFAELIVRECMFQIKEEHNLKSNGTEPAGPYAHGFDDGMFVAIKTIQEHFGVEE